MPKKKNTDAGQSNGDITSFLNSFDKSSNAMADVSTEAPPPTSWISLGNYCLNRTVSGRYRYAIPNGRMVGIAGPSGSGKSFLAGNAVKSTLDEGKGVVVIDSENALDDEYLSAIGADINSPLYRYRGVNTINKAGQLVSNFIKDYKAANIDTPFLIVVDSTDFLNKDTDLDAYEKKGEIKGDQGQHAKQIKAMLGKWMHMIKGTNLSILCTKQVYEDQDSHMKYKLTNSWRFAFSWILVIEPLVLKDDKTHVGITLKAESYKTRFTKPLQVVRVEVPYDEGMDPYNGLLEVAVAQGVIKQNVSWYTLGDDKFQRSGFHEYAEKVLDLLDEINDPVMVEIDESDLQYKQGGDGKSVRKAALERAARRVKAEDSE